MRATRETTVAEGRAHARRPLAVPKSKFATWPGGHLRADDGQVAFACADSCVQ